MKIEKCENCKRAILLSNYTKICNAGNNSKILYKNLSYTDDYFWCKGKYQQQIGKEGREFNEVNFKKHI